MSIPLPHLVLTKNTPEGTVTALVNPEGASLEGLNVNSLDLIERWDPSIPRPFSAGVSLAPWPNRVEDGMWTWKGTPHQLEITEPARRTALHGLVTSTVFDVTDHADDSIELSCTIAHEPGYPFELALSVTYRLTDRGVHVEMSATNIGDDDAPVAFGTHPFVGLGDLPTRSLTLTSPVQDEILVNERLIPTGSVPVPNDELPTGVPVDGATWDTAFSLRPPGPWSTVLAAPGGPAVEVWQDSSMPWIQLFITDVFPGLHGFRTALAIEPMSAPPNALVTGEGLTILSPGHSTLVSWGIERIH